MRASIRKRNEGLFGKHVFTLFPVERPQRPNVAWDTFRYASLGPAKIEGIVSNAHESIIRPATYELADGKILSSDKKSGLPLRQIISFPLPFIQQAKKGERIIAEGELEKVTIPGKKPYLQLTVGFPAIGEKGDEQYLKSEISKTKTKNKKF